MLGEFYAIWKEKDDSLKNTKNFIINNSEQFFIINVLIIFRKETLFAIYSIEIYPIKKILLISDGNSKICDTKRQYRRCNI